MSAMTTQYPYGLGEVVATKKRVTAALGLINCDSCSLLRRACRRRPARCFTCTIRCVRGRCAKAAAGAAADSKSLADIPLCREAEDDDGVDITDDTGVDTVEDDDEDKDEDSNNICDCGEDSLDDGGSGDCGCDDADCG